ncbi:MAG: energy-coupled thiamine transporter ThiT, partial [Bacilli bacterium]|nr:energy-coupled thiamine transporter ThiT [Bacilli bacterium]
DAMAIALIALASGISLSLAYEEGSFTVRDIAENGILIALAFGLNFIKIPVGATGGSINFQMLPLMLIALRRGPFHGLISGGIIYGLLTCLTDGYGFACFPFDYLIGFGSVAIMGFFRPFILGKEQKGYNLKGEIFLFVAGVLSTFVRYIGSNASSMIVYGLDLKGALVYNAFYIPLSGAISLAAIMLLYGPLVMVNTMYPVRRG